MPHGNSPCDAFEELCCQLAHYEQTPAGAKFTRKKAPDAGIECYWKLQDNSEWGWQAKFFLEPPGKSQWKQIDESIKTALNKHPNLSRYFICFPIDRADPRIDNQKSFMDQWHSHVHTWKGWANS